MKKLIPLLLAALTAVASVTAVAANDQRAPQVPVELVVPAGHRVSFSAFAEGVQIYTAVVSPDDPAKLVWGFTGPEAVLFDAEGGIVGCHYAYAGPTRPAWESSSGSLVVAMRTVPPVMVDAAAIPWLRLDAVRADGPGIFRGTTYIQRVDTSGGLAPNAPPARAGEEARVPYTALYVFYRAEP